MNGMGEEFLGLCVSQVILGMPVERWHPGLQTRPCPRKLCSGTGMRKFAGTSRLPSHRPDLDVERILQGNAIFTLQNLVVLAQYFEPPAVKHCQCEWLFQGI